MSIRSVFFISSLLSSSIALAGVTYCDETQEKTQIAQSNGRAIRASEHQLLVKTDVKILRFTDLAPYGADADGVVHYYCGQINEFFMVAKNDFSNSFLGFLINSKTGARFPYGQGILFSPDNKMYWSSDQPDGLDGQEWKIFTREGAEVWSGFNFIKKKGAEYAYASLSEPVWNSANELTANASCMANEKISWAVTLKPEKSGQWQPQKSCK